MTKKVIVVGSGFGGLASALRLKSKGYDVSLFEKHPDRHSESLKKRYDRAWQRALEWQKKFADDYEDKRPSSTENVIRDSSERDSAQDQNKQCTGRTRKRGSGAQLNGFFI